MYNLLLSKALCEINTICLTYKLHSYTHLPMYLVLYRIEAVDGSDSATCRVTSPIPRRGRQPEPMDNILKEVEKEGEKRGKEGEVRVGIMTGERLVKCSGVYK